jgi:hypothetical protein
MAFYIGTTNVYPGIMPAPTATSAGAPLFASTTTAGFWAYPGNSIGTPGGTLSTRSIFTHGYTTGGYKDSNPWRSVNKTWHANDVTLYCGEQLNVASAYCAGTFSDYYGYHHCAGNGYATASVHTDCYSLVTGTARTVGANSYGANPGGPFGYQGNNPTGDGQGIAYGSSASNAAGGAVYQGTTAGQGSPELSVGRTYFAGCVNQLGQVGYISGGPESTNTDKFYFPTEIMYTTNANPGVATHCTAAHGASVGWWSMAGTNLSLTYSNDSWASWSPGTTVCPDGVCKILSTKLGYHYGGTGSNSTSGFEKFSDSTGSTINASLSKPTAQGEENMQMGQNWGYCLGAYNGQQNNYTFKVNYSNDSLTALGTTSQPKGHAGMSSAMCSSAAATVALMAI